MSTKFPSPTHPQQTNLTLLYAEVTDRDHTAGLLPAKHCWSAYTHYSTTLRLGSCHKFISKARHRVTSSQKLGSTPLCTPLATRLLQTPSEVTCCNQTENDPLTQTHVTWNNRTLSLQWRVRENGNKGRQPQHQRMKTFHAVLKCIMTKTWQLKVSTVFYN